VIRLALRVRREEAELVLADLLELAPDGVEEIEVPGIDGGEGLVEYAVYGAPGELPELPDLKAAAGGACVEVSTSELPDDWSERWRQFHRSVLIEASAGDGREDAVTALHVRPPWEPPSERAAVHEIVIDPAQAFGTGAHATTRLCLELLLELAADGVGGAVLDVGAGSGVLAIAASKLGYGPVLALDHERESVIAVADNAALNGVEVEARRFDLRREELPELEAAPATIVLANLLRPLLLDLADTMALSRRKTEPSVGASTEKVGVPTEDVPSCEDPTSLARLDLIASGLLCEQADEVALAFAKGLGLREQARRERGEWAALWLTSAR
jgi:ribosomal protein L11 methyltransferase